MKINLYSNNRGLLYNGLFLTFSGQSNVFQYNFLLGFLNNYELQCRVHVVWLGYSVKRYLQVIIITIIGELAKRARHSQW